MKIVRAKFEGEIFYGELTDEGIIRYEGSPLVVWEPTEEKYSIDEIQLLAPVLPSKVTCLLYTSPSPRDREKSRMPSSA